MKNGIGGEKQSIQGYLYPIYFIVLIITDYVFWNKGKNIGFVNNLNINYL